VCMNNLRQINAGIRMYSDDCNDFTPTLPAGSTPAQLVPLFAGYKKLMKSYVGLNGASSSQDKIFACPADTFYPNYVSTNATPPWHYIRQSLHDRNFFDYSSYAFNGGDNQTRTSGVESWAAPGLGGTKLSSVPHPSRTVLVFEASALAPWSWHNPIQKRDALPYNNAQDVLSFVDGHVAYMKVYWTDARFSDGGISFTFTYDPPQGYAYEWSGN
ncbi:MAG TPA: prepilin-type cleavage/methylation domain-containing protein, partial [Verrucomicrobiae bacterium]|nr:prepilin-type cleavage/methylation domain-containing protein [Verrucomicrobiae bacterium]